MKIVAVNNGPLDTSASVVVVPEVALDVTHDQFFKLTFAEKRRAIEFLKLALDKDLLKQLQLNKLELKDNARLDEEFKEYRSDMIYKVPHKEWGETFIHVIIEHKSDTDFGAIFQLANYVMSLHAEDARRIKRNSMNAPDFAMTMQLWKSVKYEPKFGRYCQS